MKAASSWRRTDEIKKRTAGPFEGWIGPVIGPGRQCLRVAEVGS
jgi:hypothetical protein